MKKVMVFGTFDPLHTGHHFLFSAARKFGDFLIVVVARDKTVQTVKGHETQESEKQRLLNVKAAAGVDLAVLGQLKDVYSVIEEHKPDVICLGYDQFAFTERLPAELERRKITAEIIRLPAFKEDVYKSSLLKSRQKSF